MRKDRIALFNDLQNVTREYERAVGGLITKYGLSYDESKLIARTLAHYMPVLADRIRKYATEDHDFPERFAQEMTGVE